MAANEQHDRNTQQNRSTRSGLQTRGWNTRGNSSQWQPNSLRVSREQGLARALGWFSIGLGLAEVIAPKGLSKLIGVRGNPKLVRAFGVREIASGIGILAQRRPVESVWSRVAGDALDLAMLGAAFAMPKTNRTRLAAATAAVAGVTALDVICGQQLSSRP